MALDFLDRIFKGAKGHIGLSAFKKDGPRCESAAFTDIEKAVEWAAQHDGREWKGVYVRCMTLSQPPVSGKRGSAQDSHELLFLWADLDFDTEGHKAPADRELPPDAAAARSLVEAAGLPAPSFWVHSGGGLYPIWQLGEPVVVTEENRDHVESVVKTWNELLVNAARQRGWHCDNVGDLSRVLRLPGSVNWKTDNPRACVVETEQQTGELFDFTALAELTTNAGSGPTIEPAGKTGANSGSALAEGLSPFDMLDRYAEWLDILPEGWTEVPAPKDSSRAFSRPGDPTSVYSAKVLRSNPHVLVNHSGASGLPTGAGNKLTKGRLYALLYHAGDESAAARGIKNGTSSGVDRLPPAVRDSWCGEGPPNNAGSTVSPADPSGRSQKPEGLPRAHNEEIGASWKPLNLRDALSGHQPAAPTVGRRDDGAFLFYEGKTNAVVGESAAGKTWTMLLTSAQEMLLGNHVIYIDLEDDARGTVNRLRDLGIDSKIILNRFHYIRPEESLTQTAREKLSELVMQLQPTMVVIDSTGEAMSLDGVKPNNDDEVAAWFRFLPRALADLGPAVVVLDHVPKASTKGSELYGIGSQRKRAAINGAQYMQKSGSAFSKENAGHAVLKCSKDRHGHYSVGQTVAELHFSPKNGALVLNLQPPASAAGERHDFRPTTIMEQVSQALEANGPLSQNGINKRVTGKREYVTQAIDLLVQEEYVQREQKGNSHRHTHIRAYRQTDDPKSDKYEGGNEFTV